MQVKFYGTRGSIPVPEKEYMHFGGNTACVLIRFDNEKLLILDAGSGMRKLGQELAADPVGTRHLRIALSHTHWDHIQGFPFFQPAFLPEYTLDLYLGKRNEMEQDLKSIFSNQMRFEYFPIGLEKLQATIRFWEPEPVPTLTSWGGKVSACPLPHPGQSYGYRYEYGGKTIVYCTDVEHGEEINPSVVELAQGADLLIHDAQYTPEELPARQGWGHSSWLQAVQVAQQAQVKRLALFHHDPAHTDHFLLQEEKRCKAILPTAFFAREGMEVVL
jgi:phosphoribosyl 1,2-cyclic phosphodiesterase